MWKKVFLRYQSPIRLGYQFVSIAKAILQWGNQNKKFNLNILHNASKIFRLQTILGVYEYEEWWEPVMIFTFKHHREKNLLDFLLFSAKFFRWKKNECLLRKLIRKIKIWVLIWKTMNDDFSGKIDYDNSSNCWVFHQYRNPEFQVYNSIPSWKTSNELYSRITNFSTVHSAPQLKLAEIIIGFFKKVSSSCFETKNQFTRKRWV